MERVMLRNSGASGCPARTGEQAANINEQKERIAKPKRQFPGPGQFRRRTGIFRNVLIGMLAILMPFAARLNYAWWHFYLSIMGVILSRNLPRKGS